MSKFTPGPWEVDRRFNAVFVNNYPHEAWEISSPSEEAGVAICVLPYEDLSDDTRAVCTANAHLIAAAPDMYEALKQVWSLMKAADTSQMEPADGALFAAIRWQIKVALAKADGGAQ